MSVDLSALAVQLDDIVRAVPGVNVLYSATPAIVSSVRQIAPGGATTSLVQVRAADDGVQIVASIGVLASVQGPATAADVSAAILAAVPEGLEAKVHVRISRVAS